MMAPVLRPPLDLDLPPEPPPEPLDSPVVVGVGSVGAGAVNVTADPVMVTVFVVGGLSVNTIVDVDVTVVCAFSTLQAERPR